MPFQKNQSRKKKKKRTTSSVIIVIFNNRISLSLSLDFGRALTSLGGGGGYNIKRETTRRKLAHNTPSIRNLSMPLRFLSRATRLYREKRLFILYIRDEKEKGGGRREREKGRKIKGTTPLKRRKKKKKKKIEEEEEEDTWKVKERNVRSGE